MPWTMKVAFEGRRITAAFLAGYRWAASENGITLCADICVAKVLAFV